jgi:membrane protein required for colicin V production
MPLTITDAILLLVLFGFAFSGFWFGFIHMLGSFLSIIIASIIAGRYFEFAASKLSFLFGGHDNLGRIVTFIILFLLVTRLVGLVFWIIDRLFKLLTILPFLSTINRLAGAVFGLIEGIVLTSLALFLAVRFPVSDTVTQALSHSYVVDYLLNVANAVAPLLPEVVRQVKSAINS